jgi:aspartokinase
MIVLKFGGTSVEDASAIARLHCIVQDLPNRYPLDV